MEGAVVRDEDSSSETEQTPVRKESKEAWFEGLDQMDFSEKKRPNVFSDFTQKWAKQLFKNAPMKIVNSGTEKLKRSPFLSKKKKEFQEKLKMPPFLRNIDKLAYTLGVLMMVLTTLNIEKPNVMYLLYTALILPLMVIRFPLYHRQDYHYFMLDFCYYCQLLLLLYLYWFSQVPYVFQYVFALSNGPLLTAVVMWGNSLVFHDIDKLTSVFIHIYPPIVTYCIRWWQVPSTQLFAVCPTEDCSIAFSDFMVWPVILYMFWQICYILKTEVLDRHKFEQNEELMTSLRWFVKKKPHPIYRMLRARGIDINPIILLVIVQLLYTILTLVVTKLLFEFYWAHTLFLAGVFTCAVWNGAIYYFDIFSESYTKRLQDRIKGEAVASANAAAAAAAASASDDSTENTTDATTTTTTTTATTSVTSPQTTVIRERKYLAHSWNSVYSFFLFFLGMFVSLIVLIHTAIYFSSSQ